MVFDSSIWNGRRVLVTGHTGFKGSWLSLWLCQLGAEVYGVGLQPDTNPALFDQLGLAKKIAGHHLFHITDASALSSVVAYCQPHVVLHLAAQPLVRRSYRDPLGTWSTNVLGSLQLLESLKPLRHPCAVVMVTTDKVYANHEWDFGYREQDQLGGHDPYSASKAAAELAIDSWRASFCGSAPHQIPYLMIATARAGNVIGGGDWSDDRIVPDAMRSLATGSVIPVRRPEATRPWQHVLEPLGGYLLLAEKLLTGGDVYATPFNFGPTLDSNRSVRDLVESALTHWPGAWQHCPHSSAPHEAGRLHLQIDKSHHQLGWRPRWSFDTTVKRTVSWYRAVHEGASPIECCLKDLQYYQISSYQEKISSI